MDIEAFIDQRRCCTGSLVRQIREYQHVQVTGNPDIGLAQLFVMRSESGERPYDARQPLQHRAIVGAAQIDIVPVGLPGLLAPHRITADLSTGALQRPDSTHDSGVMRVMTEKCNIRSQSNDPTEQIMRMLRNQRHGINRMLGERQSCHATILKDVTLWGYRAN